MPHVRITPDDMEARLVLEAGERLNEYQALIYIARQGVRHGLLHEAIADLPDREGPAEVVVAKAVQPERGIDAYVETPFGNTAFPIKASYDAKGRAIFPELPLPGMVQAGDVIAVKVPAMPGRPGRTVSGKPIGSPPAPTLDVQLRAGLGTELAYDGIRVVATVDGNPAVVDGLVTVRPERKVPGHVGPEQGDLRYGGNVFIAGDVRGPIEVLAAGDVTVLGDVENAKLAAGGRVVVHGAICRNATVVASTDVFARAIENANVRCGGTLAVREDLIVATVEGSQTVIVGASIEGGTITASERVEARDVGGASATPTRIHLVPAPPAPNRPAPATPLPPHIRVRGTLHPGVEVRIARAMAKYLSAQPAGILREAAGSVAHAPAD